MCRVMDYLPGGGVLKLYEESLDGSENVDLLAEMREMAMGEQMGDRFVRRL